MGRRRSAGRDGAGRARQRGRKIRCKVPFVARTIVIGDVHGCAAELDALLSKLGPGTGDTLCFVGDLVARGPDSRGVLRRARELRAAVVRGNHEERLLGARAARRAGAPPPKLGRTHQELFGSLDSEEWAMLEGFPLSLELPEAGLRVVHAGVVPGVPFERQDPYLLTHLRSIADDGTPSVKWGIPWGKTYVGPPHVAFGHNARKHPQLHPDATGLDTGCVYGGALTALVLERGHALPPPEERYDVLVSVQARRAYSDYGQPLPQD
jgi:hypothetical protein